MNCGECEKSRVEQMGNGREMLFCTEARRHVGAPLATGSGKAVLGFGVSPAWCGRKVQWGIPRTRGTEGTDCHGSCGASQ